MHAEPKRSVHPCLEADGVADLDAVCIGEVVGPAMIFVCVDSPANCGVIWPLPAADLVTSGSEWPRVKRSARRTKTRAIGVAKVSARSNRFISTFVSVLWFAVCAFVFECN